MHGMVEKNNLWISILISSIVPMILGLTLSDLFSDWRWNHYPFHATLESAGSLSALTIATLMIIMINNDNLPRRFILVACALISMGLLDGFHSVLHVNISFVWLHSIATMAGGILFSAVWLPETWLTEKRKTLLLFATIIASVLTGIVSVSLPEALPTMIIDGHFSLLAKIINFSGGLGFLIGATFFVHSFYTQAERSEPAMTEQSENMVFANHCLLFGIAGLLFENSMLWDAGWWWWHILRFLAYFVVLIYFFSLFKQSQDQLRLNEFKLQNINKELELRVQERTHELEKASQAKSEFLSHMSHELRTPMNAILGFGQLLKMNAEEFNDTQRANVQEILDAGGHLMFLINEVLDLAKIESGKMEVSIEKVPVDEVLKQCIALISPQVNERQLELIDQVSSKGHTVRADFTRLKQVLLNLLSNAVKYNRDRGHIILDSENLGERLRISVTDTGQGLAQKDLARLFTSFERLDPANNVEGSGIGLVITKHLIELMDGTIGVESVPNQGATFWVELQLAHSS